MRLITTIGLLVLLTTLAFGQEIEITVRVVDKGTNKPIKNVNVVVFGTTRGTVTNALGFFKLTLGPRERQIMISHVTYKTEPITVPEATPSFTVKLEKMVYRLRGFDLHLYPTDFNLNDLKPNKVTKDLRPDSLVVVESNGDFPYEGGI